MLRGRCKGCKAHISLRYPLVELTVGLLFGAAGWHFGATPQLIDALILIGLLCPMTLIDADTMLLPDSLTLPLLWLGLIASTASLGFVSLQGQCHRRRRRLLHFLAAGQRISPAARRRGHGRR